MIISLLSLLVWRLRLSDSIFDYLDKLAEERYRCTYGKLELDKLL